MKKGLIAGLVLVIILILMPSVSAGDYFLANTPHWEDVYSSGLYSILSQVPYKFLVSPRHSDLITINFEKTSRVIILEAERAPFIKNYEYMLESEGYTVETIKFPDKKANLELAKRVDVTKFIVIDPTYGYDAISVIPYAKESKSYVLFANNDNIQEIKKLLESKNVESLIIYGDVDETVKQELSSYNPEIIDLGNRYKNNIEVAERYRKLTGAKQVLLTNGELLEASIFDSGLTKQPIVFVGKDRPPEVTMNYLTNSDYKTAVMIGNDLLQASRYVRDNSDISIFIKFGQGVTGGDEAYKEILALDIIRIPFIELLVRLQNIFYNTETQRLEVLLSNEREAKTYLRNTLVVRADNEPIISFASDNVEQIDDLETKGFAFEADLTEHIGKNITAEVLIPYGYAEEVLDTTIDVTIPVQIVTAEDICDAEILDVNYNTLTQRFEIEIETSESCYVLATVRGLTIDDQDANPQSDIERINGRNTIAIKQRMNEVDIADNENIRVEIRFGKKEDVLSQIKTQTFPLKLIKGLGLNIEFVLKIELVLGAIAIILLLIFLKRTALEKPVKKKKSKSVKTTKKARKSAKLKRRKSRK